MKHPWKRRTDASDVFDTHERTRAVLARAAELAAAREAAFIDPPLLLLAILDAGGPSSEDMITAIGSTPDALRASVERSIAERKPSEEPPRRRAEYTSRAVNALRLAMADARRRRDTGGGTPEDLLLALLLDEGSSSTKAAFRAGVDKARVDEIHADRLAGY